jgi:AcrR family transcriptional regulator
MNYRPRRAPYLARPTATPGSARARLLRVARKLFAERGYEATSVRAVTSKARVNLGAVTYYFRSKQRLYGAVLAELIEPLRDRVRSAARLPRPPLDRIEAIVRGFFEHIRQNPNMPAMMLREMASRRPVPPVVAATMGEALGTLRAIIAEGQNEGSIRVGDPLLLALSTVAQPVYLNLARKALAAVMGLDQADAATYDRVVEHAVTTVRAALRTHP